MTKKIIVFSFAVAISLLAASYRWNDSAHAIGVIKTGGGTARHPVTFTSGEESYMLIATARVQPPYHGDVKIVLEGEPALEYEVHSSGPILDLGFYSWPTYKDNILYGLKPKDRPAVWVKMKPPVVDPVCGMVVGPGALTATSKGRDYVFCSQDCLDRFKQNSARFKGNAHAHGSYMLAFYDTKTGSAVLKIPITFRAKGGHRDAGSSHH